MKNQKPLQTPKSIKAIEENLIKEKKWLTLDGRSLKVYEMEISHIQNCISDMQSGKLNVSPKWNIVFMEEINRREIEKNILKKKVEKL